MSLSLSHVLFRSALGGVQALGRMLSRDTYLKIAAELLESLDVTVNVETPRGVVRFHCDSETARQRAAKMLVKEPDMLAWIDSFEDEAVFWDIGANMGVFTVYAAATRNARVVAVDPLPLNHAATTRNLVLNNVSDRVMSFCVALSDKTHLDKLYVPAEATMSGGAGGTFGAPNDNYGQSINVVHEQYTLGYTVDDMIDTFGLPVPNYLKMDIDGPTDSVIRGAVKTLRAPELKAVMLELQPTNVPANKVAYDYIMTEMNAAGFRLTRTVALGDSGTNPETDVTNNYFEKDDT